jgi:bifunctional UDP-N-acetylglucosamine pyrophosphorylase/glucosamine-1-phosphate N-acetyltransferase
MDFAIAILAAGWGTRLKSNIAKVLHRAGGRLLIEHAVRTALELAPPGRIFVVIGHQAELVREAVESYGVGFILQREQKGTGHAIQVARPQLENAAEQLLVFCGDTPLLRASTLEALMERHRASRAAATLLSVVLDDPAQSGRIIRDAGGRFLDIVEFKSCTPEQLAIREINSAIYCFRASALFEHIGHIANNNKAGEYYLTDVPALLVRAGQKVEAAQIGAPQEMLGVNNRVELAEIDALLRARKTRELMLGGVTIYRPETCAIDPDVEIGRDTVIGPCVAIYGHTRIGENCLVRPFSTISGSVLEDGAVVQECCWLSGARLGAGASVGPFARLREGSEIGPQARIGNFVETKKTRLGRKSKAQHLAYLGDATIGENVNIGAGTITCNYDGEKKNPTFIEDGVFVGTNSSLVAPLRIGRNAYVAAGSVITEDVPEDSLAVARGRQVNKEGWVKQRRAAKANKHPKE